MAGDIKLSANFQTNVAKPLDDKHQVADVTARDALAFKYAGLLTWVVSEDRYDYWDGTQWIEDFGSGGAGNQQVFIDAPAILPAYPALVFDAVTIGGETVYKMRLNDGTP